MHGDFAVRLVDPARALALAARDGLGNRSLAYTLTPAAFATSTDESALAAVAGTSGDVDSERLTEFFASEELSGPRTFFRGVRALLPGELLLVTAAGVERRRLAGPDLAARLDLPRFEEYVELFAERLFQSVERSLAGVDRAAILLSGGLDSAPLAAVAARILSRLGEGPALSAYSWRVEAPEADERPFVEATIAATGARHEWIDCSDALPFADLARWPSHPSTPEQTAYRWIHHRSYARVASGGDRRLLVGFGGDPLYGHARRWAWELLAAEGVGRAMDRLREVAREIGWARTLRSHVVGPLLPRRRALRRSLPAWLTPTARDWLRSRQRWPPDLETARRPRQAERLLALLDAHGANVERNYLAPFGLEQRTPLRDPDLVAMMLALPDHLLQQGPESRVVLRAAMRGMLPDTVRLRRGKANFSSLIDRGLAAERLRWAHPLLRSSDALWRGIVEPAAIERWLAGRFDDDWDKIGILNSLYAELWRFRRAGGETASLLRD